MHKALLFTDGSRHARGIASVLSEGGYDVVSRHYAGMNPAAAAIAVAEAIESSGGCGLFVFDALRDIPCRSVESAEALQGADDAWDLFPAFAGALHAAAGWMRSHSVPGAIVAITSIRGAHARPGDGIYGGLCAAIQRSIQSFALDLAPYGIRVNGISVGITDEMSRRPDENEWIMDKIPMRRLCTARDIGDAVAFLASREAAYITGVTLPIDGGMTLPTMPDNLPDVSAADFVGFDYRRMKKTIHDHD